MSIIFDFGSGNTCRNDINIAREMILKLAELKIPSAVIKWQLFEKAGENIPLSKEVFSQAVNYAGIMGIPTTASVFDKDSLDFLLTFNPPFIKIANTQKSKELIDCVPHDIPLIISTDDPDYKAPSKKDKVIYCISKYPADKKEYEKKFGDKLAIGISDHTTDFDLFKKYQPKVYEVHYKLDNSVGLDAGDFARTPQQIKKMLDFNISLADLLDKVEDEYNKKVGL